MRSFYFTVLLVFTLCRTHAQLSLPEGTYHVDTQKTLALMEGERKQKYESLEAEAKARATQSMADRIFIFKEGGQVEVRWKVNGIGKSVAGTWALTGEDVLQIKINDQVTEYSFSWPTSTGLLLRNSKPAGFFSTLHLERAE